MFKPEFLNARRDVTKCMLAAAEGDLERAIKALRANEAELGMVNKDGNTALLLAVANGHITLTQRLLELKADAHHKNCQQMDVLDYASQGGVFCPMAKAVIAQYDFVAPEVRDGPFLSNSMQALAKLEKNGILVARSSILGITPDFSDILAKETEYRVEWIQSLMYMVDTVKMGLLLLDSDVAYLERDAILGGALEVPPEKRFIYRSEDKSIVRFSTALRSFYRERMQLRVLDACSNGDAMSVQGLLKAYAQPNVEDRHGQTALMRAAHNGNPTVLKCLIQARANLDARNKDGFTAFFTAAVHDKEHAVRILMRAKADTTVRSYKDHSAMDFVKHQGHRNILATVAEERERQREEEKAARGR